MNASPYFRYYTALALILLLVLLLRVQAHPAQAIPVTQAVEAGLSLAQQPVK